MKNKRILIVEVNWIGDVLFSTAAIRALKTRSPEAFIACLIHKRCKEVLSGNPYVNELIVLDEKGAHGGILGFMRMVRLLREKHFDTVYFFHRSFTRTLMCVAAGIQHRIGYATRKRRFLLTEAIVVPQEVMHRAARYLYVVLQHVEHDRTMLRYDFFTSENDTRYVRSLLEQGGVADEQHVVVIHPAGNWLPKRWPKEHIVRLADRIVEVYGAQVIFSGSTKEIALVQDIERSVKHKVFNVTGKLSLKQLGALFQRADLVVSGDSGPLHIAASLNRPLIGLFGPTSVVVTGPLNEKSVVLQKEIDCQIPCYHSNCSDNRCMKQILPEDVLSVIDEKQWLRKKK